MANEDKPKKDERKMSRAEWDKRWNEVYGTEDNPVLTKEQYIKWRRTQAARKTIDGFLQNVKALGTDSYNSLKQGGFFENATNVATGGMDNPFTNPKPKKKLVKAKKKDQTEDED